MRRAALAREAQEGLEIIDETGYVHVAWTGADGLPHLRSVHAVRFGEGLVFHGAKATALGRRSTSATPEPGRRVVVQAERVLARIPSYFTDAERACPATTFYRSVQVEGVVAPIEDLDDKAAALQALMTQFQAEGGHVPITAGDARYTKAVRGVALMAVVPTHVTAKANLGQSKPPEVKRRIIEALWRRGEPDDLEAIEWIRKGADADPAPEAWVGPKVSLHVWAPRSEASKVAVHLDDAYWNEGVGQPALAAAHRAADAWVVARDAAGALVATARAVSDDTKHAWIYDVWVDPRRRREGIASRLLGLLLDHPRVRGARLVHLHTKDAQPLYRSLGFEEMPGSKNPHMMRRGLAWPG